MALNLLRNLVSLLSSIVTLLVFRDGQWRKGHLSLGLDSAAIQVSDLEDLL